MILKKKQNESFGMKLGTRVFVQGLTNNGLAMREGVSIIIRDWTVEKGIFDFFLNLIITLSGDLKLDSEEF